jgi:hypothetical protein
VLHGVRNKQAELRTRPVSQVNRDRYDMIMLRKELALMEPDTEGSSDLKVQFIHPLSSFMGIISLPCDHLRTIAQASFPPHAVCTFSRTADASRSDPESSSLQGHTSRCRREDPRSLQPLLWSVAQGRFLVRDH